MGGDAAVDGFSRQMRSPLELVIQLCSLASGKLG